MTTTDSNVTIQKTQWTGSLMEDLCAALERGRDDDTVRGFARELIDDKKLPLAYLVRKVEEEVGAGQAERLDILFRGRVVVERERAERARAGGGLMGRLRTLFR